MRKVLALGATICLIGSVSVATAQERLQQSAGGSSLGVGTGVGDVSGSANRVQAFDSNTFLDRLSQPETVMGRAACKTKGRKARPGTAPGRSFP